MKANNLTVSTLLTFSRILLVPFIVMYMLKGNWLYACLLFTVAALTDICDGALARFLSQETEFGAYLDPIADKILLLSCYATLAFVDTPLYKIPLWFVLLVLFKEILLVLGALYVCLVKKAVPVKPTALGKITTFVQIFFMWWLFAGAFFWANSTVSYYIFLSIIVSLTLAVLMQYAIIGYKGLEA